MILVHKSYTYVGSSVLTLDSSNVSSSALVAFPLIIGSDKCGREFLHSYHSLPLVFGFTSIATALC